MRRDATSLWIVLFLQTYLFGLCTEDQCPSPEPVVAARCLCKHNVLPDQISAGNLTWKYYQLGDVIKGVKAVNRSLVSEQYPNSIADRFVRGLDKGRPGLAALRHAVRLHNPALRPEPTALIVHLRAGDVIDRSNYTVGQLLEKQRHYLIVKDGRTRDWGPYVRPRAFWRAVAAHFRGALRAVVLVAGGWGGMSAKSQRYVCAVHHVFAAAGYRVGVRYGELPDDDFAYMSRARYLVVGGGGFGLFVKTLVEAAHGTTYDPQPNGPAPGAAPPAARSGRSSLNAGPHVGEAHGADRGHGHRERIGREGPGHRNRRPRT